MHAWHDFAVVTGGAAAALVGLLFVAVSLRESALSRSRHLRLRAAQTLGLFMTVAVSAILVVLPNSADWMLGAELLVIAAGCGTVMVFFGRAAGKPDDATRLAATVDRLSPTAITPILIAVCGVLLICDLTWGLAFLALSAVLALVAGVVNAWLILVRVHD